MLWRIGLCIMVIWFQESHGFNKFPINFFPFRKSSIPDRNLICDPVQKSPCLHYANRANINQVCSFRSGTDPAFGPILSMTTSVSSFSQIDELNRNYLQLTIGTEWLPLILNSTQFKSQSFSGIAWIADGIRIWTKALKSGRTPDNTFDTTTSQSDGHADIWPGEPLFSRFSAEASLLSLPRFVQRHPELAPSIIRGLLLLSCQLDQTLAETREAGAPAGDAADAGVGNVPKTEAEVAEELVDGFVGAWAPALQGLGVLDSLFGVGHGLLLAPGSGESPEGADQAGFGLEDGVWRHTGWAEAPALQEQIRHMPALKRMVRCPPAPRPAPAPPAAGGRGVLGGCASRPPNPRAPR
jgi:hypothetical protein